MLYLQFIGEFPQRSVGGLEPPSYDEYAANIPLKTIKFFHYQNINFPQAVITLLGGEVGQEKQWDRDRRYILSDSHKHCVLQTLYYLSVYHCVIRDPMKCDRLT